MPPNGLTRRESLSRTAARRRSRRLRVAVAVSLLIHAAVIVLVLVTLPQKDKPEQLPPPAPVTMVFESGRKSQPTEPSPSAQAEPEGAPGPPVETPPATESQPPTLEPKLGPPPPPPPAEPPPPAPPVVEKPVPAPPPPPSEPPRSEPSPVEVPPPPPPAADQAKPKPAPAKPLEPRTLPKTATIEPPPKHTMPQSTSDFPAPTDFSFGAPVTHKKPATPPAPHKPGTINLALGPAQKGSANDTPYADIDTEEGGPDWRNALSRWVTEHAYYPEQARQEGEEGDARVHVVARHNGRVTSVELVGKSGSMWLDLALQALFRDAQIPALPTEGNDPIEFNFTMHYVLRRMR